MPVSPPASIRTSTIVVESHFSVPSDSGASVGNSKARTERFVIAAVGVSGHGAGPQPVTRLIVCQRMPPASGSPFISASV